MSTTARELFAQLPPRIESPEFDGWHGSYKFDITGQGIWNASVHDGIAEVHEGDALTDCVIRMDNDDFVRIINGEANLLTSWMQGRIEADGDMALLQRFQGFVRSDDRQQRREAA